MANKNLQVIFAYTFITSLLTIQSHRYKIDAKTANNSVETKVVK